MKKTTVVIDEELLQRAMEIIGAKSKRETLETGLRCLLGERTRKKLREELGTFDLDLSLEDLERLRDES